MMAAFRESGTKKKSSRKPAAKKTATRAVFGKEAPKAIDAYVNRSNPGLKDVVTAARLLIKKTVPAAQDALNPWGVPTIELNGTLCFLMVGKNHVTLGFARGTSLMDPAGLLEGTGKNIRHVKLKTAEHVADPNLRNLLLEAAILNGREPLQSSMRSRKG